MRGGSADLVPAANDVGTTLWINGWVTDANGVGSSYATGDIARIDAYLFHDTVISGGSCTANTDSQEDCYESGEGGQDECTVYRLGSNPLELYFRCPFVVKHQMLATTDNLTDWGFNVVVWDDAGDQGDGLSGTTELFHVAETVALFIPSAIAFGSRANNTQSTANNNIHFEIIQRGNDVADVTVRGATTYFDCPDTDVGQELQLSDIEWSLGDVPARAVTTTEMSTDVTDTNLEVGLRTTASDTSKSLYWNIDVPYGVTGSCTQAFTITSIAS